MISLLRSLLLLVAFPIVLLAQADDTSYQNAASTLVTTGLGSGKAFEMLRQLTGQIGGRLSGSPQAARAVEWGKQTMEQIGFERVHTEPVMVPHWVRGPVEEATLFADTSMPGIPLSVCALGGSIGTPEQGVTAEVVEVKSFDELKALGDRARGKIIFFNRPLDRTKFNTFEAYGGAVDQRGRGAVEAARAGGVAALVRSMSTRIDDVPHTGAMSYNDSLPKVPAAAISTQGANLLDGMLAQGRSLRVRLRLSCQTLPDVESANVVGELTGSEMPGEVIVVGGHLDSWDKGKGAHDDGAGVTETLEALRLLREAGLRPRRTIRAVLFMNEENGLRGGKAYASAERKDERHIAAIETDAGGFSPRGFGVQSDSITYGKIAKWARLFRPIDADRILKGGGGADISELGRKGVPLLGLRVDGQRYFDYHHSDSDTLDKVNERELELGAITLSIMAYVLAQEGL